MAFSPIALALMARPVSGATSFPLFTKPGNGGRSCNRSLLYVLAAGANKESLMYDTTLALVSDQVDVRLFGGDDRIRLPRAMMPLIHGVRTAGSS